MIYQSKHLSMRFKSQCGILTPFSMIQSILISPMTLMHMCSLSTAVSLLSRNIMRLTVSGVGDNDGYDGILDFSYAFKDLRVMNTPLFDWVFDYQAYSFA